MIDKLQLRPIEKEDLNFLHDMFNDEKMTNYWFIEPYFSKYKLEKRFEKSFESETMREFILTDGENNLGLISFYGIDQRNRNAEFAIMIHPDAQGNGYALPATKLAIDYAFRQLNLHKLYLVVAAPNVHAKRTYEKAGFKEEGIYKEEFFIDGQFHDGIHMGIFQRDYFQ